MKRTKTMARMAFWGLLPVLVLALAGWGQRPPTGFSSTLTQTQLMGAPLKDIPYICLQSRLQLDDCFAGMDRVHPWTPPG